MSRLIGISGKKRSGKDTVAEILSLTQPDVVKYWFAQQLKVEVALACNVSLAYLDTHKENFRLILQGWGTDFRRNMFGNDYWIRKMEIAVNQLSQHKTIVIPDVRFPNEYKYITSQGGIMIRVERETGLKDTHESETALDDFVFDYRIQNSGTIEELVEQVKQIK